MEYIFENSDLLLLSKLHMRLTLLLVNKSIHKHKQTCVILIQQTIFVLDIIVVIKYELTKLDCVFKLNLRLFKINLCILDCLVYTSQIFCCVSCAHCVKASYVLWQTARTKLHNR